jgi:mRNA-degrading endonuclease RelE of RelBE toxin-antitoxin system
MNHLELSKQAQRDLRRMGRGSDRDRVIKALFEELPAVPTPQNLDVKALQGMRPWMRLRIGDWRILYRSLTAAEMEQVRARGKPVDGPHGFLVDRVVNRRDLAEAVTSLAGSHLLSR